MRSTALFVQALLWLTVAASPTLIGVIIGFLLGLQAGELYSLRVPMCAAIGFIIGGLWAEQIRRTTDLSTFLGRLIAMSEFRDKNS